MSLDPAKASRFGSSKVRTGCLTCVKRHLKCDEGKPSCQRCLKAGKECRQRTGDPSLRMVHYTTQPSLVGPVSTIDAIEWKQLEHFRLKTASELSGVHDPQLWGRDAIQLAFLEPSIWYATLALASLHEQFEAKAGQDLKDMDMKQPMALYGKSINILCAAMKTGSFVSKDTPMLACAMFSAFESMGYHLHSALSHITSGLKVMVDRKHATAATTGVWTDMLRRLFHVFKRLDTQRMELGDCAFGSYRTLAMRPGTHESRLPDFSEARHTFDSVLNGLVFHIQHHHDHPGDPPATQEWVVLDYLTWATFFDELLERTNVEDHLSSAILMQIWRLIVSIMLRMDSDEGEMGFDHFHQEFEMIASLSEEYMCHTAKLIDDPVKNFRTSAPSLDELLPVELEKKHRAATDEDQRLSGFLMLGLSESTLRSQICLEAAHARDGAIKLLKQSRALHSERTTPLEQIIAGGTLIKPTFTFSHGIIYPLYTTISRCRDPAIRRRAWNLMSRCNRREGVWDSTLAAKLGQRIILIEESEAKGMFGKLDSIEELTASSQIPNHTRVRLVRPTFLPNRRAIEKYVFGADETMEAAKLAEEVWVEEIMEW